MTSLLSVCRPLAVALCGLLLALPASSAARPAPAGAHRLQAWQQLLEAMPAGERARIAEAAERVAAMPPAEQQALRQRFAGLDRLHREGWRLGPRLGRYWPGLQPLVGLVPPEQRQPLLALLWSLSDEDLHHLVRLAGRTPPEERDALRRQLLAQPAAARSDWLRRQAGGG